MNKSCRLENTLSRAVLPAAALVCLVVAGFFVKWCLANSIAAQVQLKEVAELSVALAPNDPQTHYSLAVLNEKTFLSADLPKNAITEPKVIIKKTIFRRRFSLLTKQSTAAKKTKKTTS